MTDETPEMTDVCPSCGGASFYVPDGYGDCETCDSTGVVEPYPVPQRMTATECEHGMAEWRKETNAMCERFIAARIAALLPPA